MGDSGAARQLQRLEWYWHSPQARLPHTPPRASPPRFRPVRTCCPSTSTAFWMACSTTRRTPLRRRPPRSPRPRRTLTSRSRAARRGNLPLQVRRSLRSPPRPRHLRSLSPPRLRPLSPPRLRPPSPRPASRRRRPRRRPPSLKCPPPKRRPPACRPLTLRPGQRRRAPRPQRRRPPPPRRRRLRVALPRSRPTRAPAARRWRPPQRVSPADRPPCWAWGSDSWRCPSSPVPWSCGCAASERRNTPCPAGWILSPTSH